MNTSLNKIRALVYKAYGMLYFGIARPSADDVASGLSLAEAFAMYNDGATFVDVRRPSEWRRGSVRRALFASGASFDHVSPKPAADETLVAFCEAGDRASNAARKLREQGYSNVYFLRQGGYSSWASAGYPIAE